MLTAFEQQLLNGICRLDLNLFCCDIHVLSTLNVHVHHKLFREHIG